MWNVLSDDYTIVGIRDGKIIYQNKGIGVSPIIKKINENEDFFKDMIIVDKIIGKAAAILLIRANVKKIYAKVISKEAIKVLDKYHIDYEYLEVVNYIHNRDNTGLCPLEDSVKDTDDLEIGYKLIKERINILMSNKGV